MDALARVKAMLGPAAEKYADLLPVLVESAAELIRAYCNRDDIPSVLTGAQAELAVIAFNRIGTEGEQSRSTGNVSMTFIPGGDIPASIKARLNRFRKAGYGVQA